MAVASVLAWLALSLVVLGLGAPVAAAVFPRLADRGASVALPLVLTVVFFASYYVGRLSLWLAIGIAALIIAGASSLALRREVGVPWSRVVEVGLVFAVAYLFLVAIRSTDPAIIPAGGEKFLDFGLLKSLLRSTTVPPVDFWFAGEPVLYYYGGHLLVAQGVRLFGAAPGVAYNLALASVFGAYVSAAYGLAGNIAARDGAFDRQAALLGGFFVAWASNLFTPIRLLLRPLPDGLAEEIARTLDVWAGRYDREGAVLTDAEPFSMWDATGVIDGAIHETPLFAFVNGDLHAHMMAPPFTLLLVALLFASVRTPAEKRRRRLLLLFGAVPAVGGALAVINTWSFFATGGLTTLAILFDRDLTDSLPRKLRPWVASTEKPRAALSRLAVALGAGAVAASIAVVLSLPFWLGSVGGRAVGLFPDRSSLPALVVVHGTFLLPVALYFGYLAWARFDLSQSEVAGGLVVALAGIALATFLDVAAVGLVLPFLVVGSLLGAPLARQVRTRFVPEKPTVPGFELVALLGALGVILLVEFVYLLEHAGFGRFNTVFKMYAQVWALLAVGTAAALGKLRHLAPQVRPVPQWPTVIRGFVALLIVLTSVYGVLAVGPQVGDAVAGDADLDLDGTAWLERFHPTEARAIDWLGAREGTPTVLTRPGEAYSWPGAISVFTGLPTVVGWQHHQRGFGRQPSVVAQRAADVDAIYTGRPVVQRDLLGTYDVRYVYVGPSEREKYGEELVVTDLDGLEQVKTFGDGEVTIYRVSPAILGA